MNLELECALQRNIKDNGTLMQYTADVTERLLITHCKLPFERTSRQASSFVDQIVALLNREESVRHFDLYLILRQSEKPLKNIIVLEDEEVSTINPASSLVTRILPGKETSFTGPCPFHNFFADPKGLLSSSGAITFHVTVQPDRKGLTVMEMQEVYPFPNAVQYIENYIYVASGGEPTTLWSPSSGKFNLWHKCRIQQCSSFRSRHIMRSQVIQAHPHSDAYPFGAHDAILLGRSDADNVMDVARIKAIFSPKVHTNVTLPSYLASPLLFVEYFTVCSTPEGDPECVGLYRVQRPPPVGSTSDASNSYGVVLLTDIVHAVELVPVFYTTLPDISISKALCLVAYQEYYVNSFADKESFNVIC